MSPKRPEIQRLHALVSHAAHPHARSTADQAVCSRATVLAEWLLQLWGQRLSLNNGTEHPLSSSGSATSGTGTCRGRIAPVRSTTGQGSQSPPALAELQCLEDALAVGRAMAESPLAGLIGGHVGWKMGWKGAYAERQALCGPLFGAGLIPSGCGVSLAAHSIFSAEAEFGVVLRESLEPRERLYNATEVWAAVDHLELCIELCGARQVESQDPLHYVADALLGAAVVRGTAFAKKDVNPAQLPAITVRLLVQGTEVSNGNALNNPGESPLASLCLLVNELCVERQRRLAAGMLVICGHCCQAAFKGRPSPALPPSNRPEWGQTAWAPNNELVATFEGYGSVNVTLQA